ncbi:MAG: hypothetical protein ACI35Z_08180 [Sphingobacterium hotanense]
MDSFLMLKLSSGEQLYYIGALRYCFKLRYSSYAGQSRKTAKVSNKKSALLTLSFLSLNKYDSKDMNDPFGFPLLGTKLHLFELVR